MKKLLINTLVLLAAGLVASCSKTEGPAAESAPSVSVEVVYRDLTSITVKFVPSDNTSMYKFALGNEFDRDNFLSDDIVGTITEVSNNPVEYTFTGLENATYYVVYAVAYGSNNNPGPITSRGVQTMDADFLVTKKFVSDVSAAFLIECTTDFYSWSCALGTADDKDAFLNNLMPGITTFDEETRRQINFFDLEKGTEYVFYCIGYDRAGRESQLFQIPFTTYNEGDSFPDFDIEIGALVNDFYGLSYSVTPNPLCSEVKMIAIEPNGYYDLDIIDYRYNNIIDEFIGNVTNANVATPNAPWVGVCPHETMGVGAKQRAYLATYDLNGELVHVKRFDTTANSLDPSLVEPNAADLKISIRGDLFSYNTVAFEANYDENSGIRAYYIELIDVDFFERTENNGCGGDLQKLYDKFVTGMTTRSGCLFVYNRPYYYDGLINASTLADPDKEWMWAAVALNANGLQGMATELSLSEKFTISQYYSPEEEE